MLKNITQKRTNSILNNNTLTLTLLAGIVIVGTMVSAPTPAKADEKQDGVVLGARIRGGAKYDNVRICSATDPGVPGGPDIDVSIFAVVPVGDKVSLDINLPVMRPIVFGVDGMLQFEPEVSLLFRRGGGSTQLVFGPSLGVTLNYLPDYQSEDAADERTDSFFSIGPRIGGYIGLDFTRPTKRFNFQLGLHPYVSPLFSINDPEEHRGLVAGGTLDMSFRFNTSAN